MKTIYAVRHAKSSWGDPQLSDKLRPLNDRGKRNAPQMAEMMVLRDLKPDVLISSTAKRARSTAKYFRKGFGLSKDQLFFDHRLYLADSTSILSILQELPDAYKVVAFFGHNPGITSFVNQFSSQFVENVPTCGIARLLSGAEHWYDLNTKNTRLIDFYFPKQFGF